MKKIILNALAVMLLISCTKPDRPDSLPASFLDSDGVFIINEGNFRVGNGSVSFYSYDSAKVFNNIFSKLNNRILGDIPNSMKFNEGNAYIIVNNSGKIEVVDKLTMLSVKTISGLNSPRHIAFSGNQKAYVTSMYSDSVTLIDLTDNSISGYINIRRSSESIEIVGERAFVAQWVGGNEVIVINTATDKIIDSIEVGIEPESMALDVNNTLWVLCNGGWSGENPAELIALNTVNFEISKRLLFPARPANPTCLQLNGSRNALYFLQNGVRYFPVDATGLPADPLIEQGDHSFYKIGIDPVSGDILVTDAVDYQKKGYLLHYSQSGNLISQFQTEIIPGFMMFKNYGSQ